MKSYIIPVTTTGAAGSATGTASAAVQAGLLIALEVVYASAPATADVTITEVVAGVTRTLLTKSNNATSFTWRPLVLGQDNTGANVAAWYIPDVVFGGFLTVTVAQSDAVTNNVTVIAIVGD